jgi:hypothetical protein
MAISTPLMIEILQHFARVFPMPGRIDDREDHLALAKTWADQLEPYSDEQVKVACRRLMGKLKRFPYPSDVRDELAPASAASTIVGGLSIAIDAISIDLVLSKVEQLKVALADRAVNGVSLVELACEARNEARDTGQDLGVTLQLLVLAEQRRTNELLLVGQAHIKQTQTLLDQSHPRFS